MVENKSVILISDTTSFNRLNINTIRYEEKNAVCMTDPTKHGRRVDMSKARFSHTSYDYSDYGSEVNLFELHCH